MSQNFENHRHYVPGFHGLTGLLIIIGIIGAVINVVKSFQTNNIYSASLILLLFIIGALLFWYSRTFSLKAHDKAIRAEESLRYYQLTGKTLPVSLRMGQIVALRFAPDDELVELVDRALTEKLSGTEIKKAIKLWKADHNRV